MCYLNLLVKYLKQCWQEPAQATIVCVDRLQLGCNFAKVDSNPLFQKYATINSYKLEFNFESLIHN
ncbi:hypothetical protein IM40_01490 [Candidatus Paracaedimonas acanthamoebae]|nr:hypothetical protein IM40_01490 [Candidatus Paracaedimonas acanthamoebae]